MVTHFRVEVAPVGRDAHVAAHVSDAHLVRVSAGEQGGTARAAAGGVVELAEPQPVGGQAIEVGRGDLRTVAAEIRVSQIVGQDQDDVWSGRDRGRIGVGRVRQEYGRKRQTMSRFHVRYSCGDSTFPCYRLIHLRRRPMWIKSVLFPH